jgi:hypothetical protein
MEYYSLDWLKSTRNTKDIKGILLHLLCRLSGVSEYIYKKIYSKWCEVDNIRVYNFKIRDQNIIIKLK